MRGFLMATGVILAALALTPFVRGFARGNGLIR
jgi:hypothetical protein